MSALWTAPPSLWAGLAPVVQSVTESAGARKAVGQVVVPRQRNVDLPFSGGSGTPKSVYEKGGVVPWVPHVL